MVAQLAERDANEPPFPMHADSDHSIAIAALGGARPLDSFFVTARSIKSFFPHPHGQNYSGYTMIQPAALILSNDGTHLARWSWRSIPGYRDSWDEVTQVPVPGFSDEQIVTLVTLRPWAETLAEAALHSGELETRAVQSYCGLCLGQCINIAICRFLCCGCPCAGAKHPCACCRCAWVHWLGNIGKASMSVKSVKRHPGC
eukprot:TRINITY_DN28883_c0_g1_i1.p1 TRINITY_DN28883_c0_g1~~TRINITY_DN28883_c0_g1_i1.p1  ORF type:complete len:201 (-),score=20.96 TRINITY_DN28883_c0_g1_i1:259-861(-)